MRTRAEETAGDYDLQLELRDLLCLAVVGDHVRWVVRGEDAAELVEWLCGAVVEWRAWADQVAKLLAASGVAPDARVRSLAKDIAVHWVPSGWLEAGRAQQLLLDRLTSVAGWAGHRRAQATGAAAELLDVVCAGLEAQLQERREIVPLT
jgi:hypothetical protein